jgi:hypothetical protein
MKERYDLVWSNNSEILTWKEYEYFLFDEEASAESDTDRLISSLYMPFVGLRAGLTKPDAGELVCRIFSTLPHSYSTVYNVMIMVIGSQLFGINL